MDFDNNGLLDLIVGDRNGYVNFFRGQINGTLTAEPDIKANGVTIDVGNNSAPFIVDWNEDGLLDLVVGHETGNVRLYLNSGNPFVHNFTTFSLIEVGGTAVKYSRTVPHVIDLNLDGRKDVVIGEDNGAVYYLENAGTNTAPFFNTSSKLKSDGASIQWPSGQTDTTVFITDWNEDGIPDLLLGNYVKNVYLYPGLAPIMASDNQISGASGCNIDFSLDAGAAYAGRRYFLMGTTAGTVPGLSLPGGAVLPVNWSNLSSIIYQYYNSKPLTNFRGHLDLSGKATATLQVSSTGMPLGTVLHFAFTTEQPYDFQSNPVPVEVVP